MQTRNVISVENPAAAAILAPLVPHRVVPRLVVSAVVALFADPPRPAPGPGAAAATFAAIGLRDPTALATLPTGDAPAGPLRVTVRPPTAAAAARAPDCPGPVAEWVAASAAEARRRGLVPAESAEDDVASVPHFVSRRGAGKVVGDVLSEAMRARGVRCGAVGCLVIAGIDDTEAALCTTVLVRRFRPAWVCFAGDTEALHRDTFLGCNGDADVFDLSRLPKLKHLPIAQGGYCVQDKLRRIVLPRLSAAPLKTNSIFSMYDLQGLHVPWNWRTTCLGESTVCYGHSLAHVDLSYQKSLTAVGMCSFQECQGLVSACFRGCVNLSKLGYAAFLECKRLRIVDFAECPKMTSETITANAFESCNALELIITAPQIDTAETSQRLKTEWKIDNVKVVHWPSEGGDASSEAVIPDVRRILDSLEAAHSTFRGAPDCKPSKDCEANVLKPQLNTVERLPLPGVVPALPADYSSDSEAPAPARQSCPCCVALVERYRRMQSAYPPAAPASSRPAVQPGVFGATVQEGDAGSAAACGPTKFGRDHLVWSCKPDTPPSSSSDDW